MERTNNRKIFTGKVVSDKMDKTVTVVVDIYRKDRLYGKRVKQSKKYHVHDEESIAKVGDIVEIVETRPLSKTKKHRILEVVRKVEE